MKDREKKKFKIDDAILNGMVDCSVDIANDEVNISISLIQSVELFYNKLGSADGTSKVHKITAIVNYVTDMGSFFELSSDDRKFYIPKAGGRLINNDVWWSKSIDGEFLIYTDEHGIKVYRLPGIPQRKHAI